MNPHSTILLWGAAGVVACASMVPLEPNMLEEGLILEIAQRLNHGDRLYQDVVAFTGPLPFETLALLFRVFGEEIFVGRAVVALLHGAATAAAFALARAARSDSLAHLAGAFYASAPILLFPLLSTYFYTTLAVSIGMLASWASLAGLHRGRWALWAGVLVAFAALCKQTIGATLALGLFVAMFACASPPIRRRSIGLFGLGGACIAVVSLVAFAASGGLHAFVYSMIELPMSFESGYTSPFMNFFPPGVFSEEIRHDQAFHLPYFYTLLHGGWGLSPGRAIVSLTQLLYALPFLAIAATLLRRFSGPLPVAAWLHFAALLAVTTNLFPRSDWGHLVAALPCAFVQLVVVAPPPRAAATGSARWTGCLVGGLAAVSVGVGAWLYWISAEPSFGPRVPLRVVNPGYREKTVSHAIEYIREHTDPGDAIFVARAEPLVYFATDTRNPTPYGGVIPTMFEEQQEVIVEALRTTPYVVMTDIDQPVFTYYRDVLPRVQRTLERHFHIPQDYLLPGTNWMLVLERGPDRGPTQTDLIDIAPKARHWARTRNGGLVPAPIFREAIGTLQNHRFLPVVLGARGGGIDFDVRIPEGAVFQAGVGYPAIGTAEKRVFQHPRDARMKLSIEIDGAFRLLAEERVSTRKSDIARWTPFEVELSGFAGRETRLRLEIDPGRPIRPGRLGWWGSPRIATPAEPGDA